MNRIIVCACLMLFILFSSSCQQKKIVHIPVTPTTLAPEKPMEKLVEIQPKSIEFKQGTSKDIVWTDPKPFGIKKNLIPFKQKGIDGQNFIMSSGSYPSFNGLSDKQLEQKINQIIKGYIEDEIEKFWREHFNEKVEEISGRNIYNEWYQIIYLDSRLCSILFFRYGYRWTESKVMNINLIQGRLIKTSEWFNPGYDYQKVMNEYCKKDLIDQCFKRNNFIPNMENRLYNNLDPAVSTKGFYLLFNAIFGGAEGDFSVTIPFSDFGENCLLKSGKSLYGYYDCPEGWSYRDDRFLIKYPAVLDNNSNETNVTSTTKDDGYSLVINLPLSDCSHATIEISSQSYYDPKIKPKPIDTKNKEKTTMIDDSLFEKNRVFVDQKNSQTNKTVREETFLFRTIRDRMDLIEYSIKISIKSLPFETEKIWQERAYKTYYQINQVLSTFEFLS